jgi:hypothetical protein
LGHAYCVVSDPDAHHRDTIKMQTLIVEEGKSDTDARERLQNWLKQLW